MTAMITSPIVIDGAGVTITPKNGEIWMTKNEIARTFGVFVQTVGGNVRSILKSGLLREAATVRHTRHRDGSVTTLYNLEMINALAHRFDSWQAEIYRRWIVRQIVSPAVVWKVPRQEAMAN